MKRRAEWALAALVALGLSFLVPIGLASSESADLAVSALGVGRPLRESVPLAEVLARAVVLVPFGELGARPHAIAVFCGAIASALLLARLRLGTAVGARPNTVSEGESTLASVVVGVLLVVCSRPFLEIATMRPASAVDFVLFAAIALCFEMIRRDPARASVGLGLALLCGLAAGAGWSVRAVAWPVASTLTAWALRRGERWPLLAPTVFVAGAGVALVGVVGRTVDPPATFGPWWREIITHDRFLDASTLKVAASLLGDDIGVLALLAVAVGGVALVWRRPAETIFFVLLSVSAAATSLSSGDILLARLILIAGAALPIARGHATLALPFGRARGAVSLVLGVVIVMWPAVVGIGSVLAAPGRRVPSNVARRLDAAVALPSPPRIDVLPDREAARWRRYARVIGGGPPTD